MEKCVRDDATVTQRVRYPLRWKQMEKEAIERKNEERRNNKHCKSYSQKWIVLRFKCRTCNIYLLMWSMKHRLKEMKRVASNDFIGVEKYRILSITKHKSRDKANSMGKMWNLYRLEFGGKIKKRGIEWIWQMWDHNTVSLIVMVTDFRCREMRYSIQRRTSCCNFTVYNLCHAGLCGWLTSSCGKTGRIVCLRMIQCCVPCRL